MGRLFKSQTWSDGLTLTHHKMSSQSFFDNLNIVKKKEMLYLPVIKTTSYDKWSPAAAVQRSVPK